MSNDKLPVVKIPLKRADACELIYSDKILSMSPFVTVLGPSLSSVMAHATLKRFADKVVICQQGEAGSSLLFVLGGSVRLSARKDRDAVELGLVSKGDLIGEREVLDGAMVRHTSAVAEGAVDLAELPRESLLVNGALARGLAKLLRMIHDSRMRSLDEMTDFLNRW